VSTFPTLICFLSGKNSLLSAAAAKLETYKPEAVVWSYLPYSSGRVCLGMMLTQRKRESLERQREGFLVASFVLSDQVVPEAQLPLDF
jgi:hypothetical protein